MAGSSAARELLSADDEVLMARFASGEDRAFEELYRRYEQPLYSFCLRLLGGDADQAEDAFQDALMTLIDQRHRYRDQGRLRGWIYTIARNTCLDRARRGERRARLLTIHRESLAERVPRPDIRVEARDALSDLLSGIPPEQREVILLHRHAGFSYAEIAVMQGCSEAAAKQKAYRGLCTLRERRKKMDEESGS